MRNLALALIWTSVLSFLAATILVIFGQGSLPFLNTGPEGFSRVSSNLALIAIALGVWFKSEEDDDGEN
jgi:hypothetical protein